jgi:WD40 repeat protein
MGVRSAATLTPGGRRLVMGGADGNVRVWNTATGRPAHHWRASQDAIDDIEVSPDGRMVVTVGGDVFAKHPDFAVRLWSINARRAIGVLRGHN